MLYTIMVRDKYGSWIPGTYIIMAFENSNIIDTSLKQVSIAIFCSYD